MANWEKDAKESEARAEQALTVSWSSLKFTKDTLTASLEYSSAATSYTNGKNHAKAVECLRKVFELKRELGDQQGAGRACEQAARIEETQGHIGAALELWEQGTRCFRLADKGDLAARLLLKSAEACAKEEPYHKNVPELYEEVLSIHEDASQLYNSPEVFRDYQAFLLRSKQIDRLFTVMTNHVSVLIQLNQLPFAYRELLGKVVVACCYLKDVVRADDAINSGIEVAGWLGSNEFGTAQDLIDSIQHNDAEKLAATKKQSTLNSLQVDVIRLIKAFELSDVGADFPDLS
eukprot:GEMP01065237.1.p1 GENE.GEMP01065237.1~~GEMP01065237.1.p1  ORF type:complete len:291 (+),score=41.56 GEMP01065237.1:103-975(+)